MIEEEGLDNVFARLPNPPVEIGAKRGLTRLIHERRANASPPMPQAQDPVQRQRPTDREGEFPTLLCQSAPEQKAALMHKPALPRAMSQRGASTQRRNSRYHRFVPTMDPAGRST